MVVNEGATEVVITPGPGVTVNTLAAGTAALVAGKAAWVIQMTLDEWLVININ